MEKSCTFAAVNVKTKRQIASRVLLVVLLPMLLLSSLHIHPQQSYATNEECADCVQHHCDGHIVLQLQTTDDCVLCQFLSLHIVMAARVDVTPINNVCKPDIVQCQHSLLSLAMGILVTRGPPAA